MKFVNLSDTHSKHRKIELPDEEIDFLFHSGDFCNITHYGEPEDKLSTYEQALDFVNWLCELTNISYKVFISGNHETFLNDPTLRKQFEQYCKSKKEEGIIFLDESGTCDLLGVKIKGVGCYPHIMKEMPSKWAYYEREGFYDKVFGEEKVHIMLTHACPTNRTNDDSDYTCTDLSYFIEEHKQPPQLLLCGHVHEKQGDFVVGKSKVINSACILKPKVISLF
jgi:Icc-related predicted phosphoesterase